MLMLKCRLRCKAAHDVKLYAAMLALEISSAGMYVLGSATLKDGMNQNVLIVYRCVFAAASIAPFALYFERNRRPSITRVVFLKMIALAMLEPVLQQHLYYIGMKWTSATFTSAMANAIPAITFVMALALGKEKLEIRGRKGQAKAIGTVLTVVGTVLMVLYKGPILEFLRLSDGRNHQNSGVQGSSSWTEGTFMLMGSCICWAAFLILQSNTMETYPAALSLTTGVCVMGALVNAAVALVVEQGNGEPWMLGWDMRLLCAAYSGIICTGVSYFVYALVTNEKGPVFASAFDPLCLIITALFSSVFLAEEIALGRAIGATITVAGLYCLLWGKKKEHEKNLENGKDAVEMEHPHSSSNHMQPVSTEVISSNLKGQFPEP